MSLRGDSRKRRPARSLTPSAQLRLEAAQDEEHRQARLTIEEPGRERPGRLSNVRKNAYRVMGSNRRNTINPEYRNPVLRDPMQIKLRGTPLVRPGVYDELPAPEQDEGSDSDEEQVLRPQRDQGLGEARDAVGTNQLVPKKRPGRPRKNGGLNDGLGQQRRIQDEQPDSAGADGEKGGTSVTLRSSSAVVKEPECSRTDNNGLGLTEDNRFRDPFRVRHLIRVEGGSARRSTRQHTREGRSGGHGSAEDSTTAQQQHIIASAHTAEEKDLLRASRKTAVSSRNGIPESVETNFYGIGKEVSHGPAPPGHQLYEEDDEPGADDGADDESAFAEEDDVDGSDHAGSSGNDNAFEDALRNEIPPKEAEGPVNVELTTGPLRPTPSKRPREEENGAVPDQSRPKRSRAAHPEAASYRTSETGVELREDVPEQSLSLVTNDNANRFHKQWGSIQTAFKYAKDVGRRTKDGEVQVEMPRQRDKDIKEILDLCKTAKGRFTNLKNGTGEDDADREPANLVIEIAARVDGIRDGKGGPTTSRRQRNRVLETYAFLFPQLTLLIRTALLCYESIDTNDSHQSEGKIFINHLKEVNKLIELVLDLWKTVSTSWNRPDDEYKVKKPVQGLNAALRRAHKGFSRVIFRHDENVDSARSQAEHPQARAQRLEQEERKQRSDEHLLRLRTKWHRLHEERRLAEGGFPALAKVDHLKIPDPHFDVDQYGVLYRVQVFHERVGPPPGLVDEARTLPWSMAQLTALEKGLRDYAGVNVYERTFRKFCGQGGPLNAYNVTQIVTVAADLREYLIKRQGEDVQDWLKSLFVWTHVSADEGQENVYGEL